MDKSTYLLDPCSASSLPYWKTDRIAIPQNLLILREDDPRLETVDQRYIDTPYFKLVHYMDNITAPTLPDGFRFFCPSEKELSDHIASCYDTEGVSEAELLSYRLYSAYSPDLWLAIADGRTNKIVASGIAEMDTDAREGVLEWIQVSPAYRCQGWGRIIVDELLFRMKGRADFVTVSGKLNSPSDPRRLYERCGFGNMVVWHVLRSRQPLS